MPTPVNIEYLVNIPEDIQETITSEYKAFIKDQIYKIIMTFAFPMSTNPLNQSTINELPISEREMLYASELDFLQYKINQQHRLTGIKLLTIPKSLYQLYSVLHIYNNRVELPKFIPDASTTMDVLMYQHILNTINSKEYKGVWWGINDELIFKWGNTIDDINCFIENTMEELSRLFKDEPLKAERYIVKAGLCGCGEFNKYLNGTIGFQKTVEFLKLVALKEYKEEKNYLLYCGKYNEELKFESNVSWSFSDGLMGGFIYDKHSGCCLDYLLWEERTLWSFAIEKSKYQFDGSSDEKSLFYIPPIPNILSLTGSGEFHHPRTKVSKKSELEFQGILRNDLLVSKINSGQEIFITNDLAPDIYEEALQKLSNECYREIKIELSGVATYNSALVIQFSLYKKSKPMDIKTTVVSQNDFWVLKS